ncbi:MAG: GNAT family N-acetyltransferase [Dolichospermum sp.]
MVYIVPFNKSDLESTIRCISHSFTQETMSQALGIDVNSYVSLAEIFSQRAIQYQLSLVAKNEDSGDVVGFSILEDFLAETPNLEDVDSRFLPIMNVVDELKKWYINNYAIKSGEILYISMTGVDEKYQGQGIAHQLMEETFQVARNNNYKGIIAECTGASTQHICAKHGFKVVKEIEYKTFLYNEELVFKHIEKPSGCQLMLKTFD